MPHVTSIAESPPVSSVRAWPGKRGPRVWWWPHLLSLDAPFVAVVWQHWWSRTAGVRLAWWEDAILGGGVWLIYLADRLADTASTAPGSHETARHSFYQRRQPGMRLLAITVFLFLSFLAPWRLDARQLIAGLGLLALAGGYFWLVHRRSADGWARVWPKEAFVAVMFTAGTIFFVFHRVGVVRSEMCLFGALCFLNCALITKWERKSSDLHDPASLLNAFPRLTAHLRACCVVLALLAGVFSPVALSALLLAMLDRTRTRLSPVALRVLADAALLTPCLYWTIPPHR